MEQLHNGYTLELCDGAFPLSTDSVALSHFAKLPRNASVLDLGSGCGTLGLLLCSCWSDCTVTGVDLDPAAHLAALANAQRNEIGHRLNSICDDVANIPNIIKPGTFSCCISNPPYFSGGPASQKTPAARSEATLDLDTLFRSAAWALKYRGDFFLVHKPERLAELIACGARENLEAKRLRLVRHKESGNISLILLQFRKGGKPGLIIEEGFLHQNDGTPSAYYKEIYHLP